VLSRYVIRNANLVRWLLEHGADPNKEGFWREVPITLACTCSIPEVVDLLLAHGGSLHSYCLHVAARVHEPEVRPQSLTMLSHLLDLGMDVNEKSDMGLPSTRSQGFITPLHAAAGSDFADAVRLLLNRGANREIKSSTGETPLERAIRTGSEAAVKALKEN
jgi:ankyrin repeat protein